MEQVLCDCSLNYLLNLANWHQFSCICPVIDRELRHAIVVLIYPQGDYQVDLHTTLTVLWRKKNIRWHMNYVAYVASVSVGFRGKELPREKKERGGEGKEGNACRQTPGFWKPPTLRFMPGWFHAVMKHSSCVCNPCARKIRNLGSLYFSV